MNKVTVFLAAFAMRLLSRLAQNIWDELWRWIVTLVVDAERKWIESGQGADRRQWALDQLMVLVDERIKELSWIQKMLLRLFLGEILDTLIGTVNDEFGHDWGRKIDELEDKIAEWLPFVNPTKLVD